MWCSKLDGRPFIAAVAILFPSPLPFIDFGALASCLTRSKYGSIFSPACIVKVQSLLRGVSFFTNAWCSKTFSIAFRISIAVEASLTCSKRSSERDRPITALAFLSPQIHAFFKSSSTSGAFPSIYWFKVAKGQDGNNHLLPYMELRVEKAFNFHSGHSALHPGKRNKTKTTNLYWAFYLRKSTG